MAYSLLSKRFEVAMGRIRRFSFSGHPQLSVITQQGD